MSSNDFIRPFVALAMVEMLKEDVLVARMVCRSQISSSVLKIPSLAQCFPAQLDHVIGHNRFFHN
jgi:hypothetical protein